MPNTGGFVYCAVMGDLVKWLMFAYSYGNIFPLCYENRCSVRVRAKHGVLAGLRYRKYRTKTPTEGLQYDERTDPTYIH